LVWNIFQMHGGCERHKYRPLPGAAAVMASTRSAYPLSFRPKACPERSRMGGEISYYSRSIPLTRNSERCLPAAAGLDM